MLPESLLRSSLPCHARPTRRVRADLRGTAGDQAVPASAVAPTERTLSRRPAPAPGTLARRGHVRAPAESAAGYDGPPHLLKGEQEIGHLRHADRQSTSPRFAPTTQ